jgi:hypothetical protein
MSETNDLQAARERFLQWLHGPREPKSLASKASVIDAYELAKVYCELHDETPITEEFAIEITQRYPILERDEYPFNAITTMGQVRALLLAMGVKHD